MLVLGCIHHLKNKTQAKFPYEIWKQQKVKENLKLITLKGNINN